MGPDLWLNFPPRILGHFCPLFVQNISPITELLKPIKLLFIRCYRLIFFQYALSLSKTSFKFTVLTSAIKRFQTWYVCMYVCLYVCMYACMYINQQWAMELYWSCPNNITIFLQYYSLHTTHWHTMLYKILYGLCVRFVLYYTAWPPPAASAAKEAKAVLMLERKCRRHAVSANPSAGVAARQWLLLLRFKKCCLLEKNGYC